MEMDEIYISQALEGQRLDNALLCLFPNLSLRARRKLWHKYYICLDNISKPAGYRVRTGQKLSLRLKNIDANTFDLSHNAILTEQVRVLQSHEDLIFIDKPRGLHSVHLNTGGLSLESILPTILGHEVTLYNRLDAQTSGIVVVSKQDVTAKNALKKWHDFENTGQCEKRYVALVQGKAQDCIVDMTLDTYKRKKTRVLEYKANFLRQSKFQVLAKVDMPSFISLCNYFPDFTDKKPCELYFVGCTIYKGARHQIRAHAAYGGFTLFNDLRYEGKSYTQECFLLHHGALILPQIKIFCTAHWETALSQNILQSIKHFFNGA